MILKRKYHVLLMIVFWVVSSCGKDSACFKGTGRVVKETRNIANDITSIVTKDNIDIVITQGTEAIMTIEGGENLLPYIKTDFSDGVLSISSDNRCGMFRDNTIPITLYVTVPNLTYIEYTGQGTISSTNQLNFPFFEIDSYGGTGSFKLNLNSQEVSIKQHSGPADFIFSGQVRSVYVYTLGQGWFYLDKMVAQDAHVNHSGIGNIYLNTAQKLTVEMRSRGSVFYLGNPKVGVSPNIGEGVVAPK